MDGDALQPRIIEVKPDGDKRRRAMHGMDREHPRTSTLEDYRTEPRQMETVLP